MDVITKQNYEDMIEGYKKLITKFEADEDWEDVERYKEYLTELIDEFEWLKTEDGWKYYQENRLRD